MEQSILENPRQNLFLFIYVTYYDSRHGIILHNYLQFLKVTDVQKVGTRSVNMVLDSTEKLTSSQITIVVVLSK